MSGPRGVTLTEMIEQARKFADANVAQLASYSLTGRVLLAPGRGGALVRGIVRLGEAELGSAKPQDRELDAEFIADGGVHTCSFGGGRRTGTCSSLVPIRAVVAPGDARNGC